jgi:membrane protein
LLTSAVSAFGPGLGQRLLTGRIATFTVGSLGSFALFFAIYALLPARRMGRRALIFGALASTVLFTLGRIGIGFYLSHSDAVVAFGASGSLVVFLLWIYYSSLAFFAGALAVQVFEQPFSARALDDHAAVPAGGD